MSHRTADETIDRLEARLVDRRSHQPSLECDGVDVEVLDQAEVVIHVFQTAQHLEEQTSTDQTERRRHRFFFFFFGFTDSLHVTVPTYLSFLNSNE